MSTIITPGSWLYLRMRVGQFYADSFDIVFLSESLVQNDSTMVISSCIMSTLQIAKYDAHKLADIIF